MCGTLIEVGSVPLATTAATPIVAASSAAQAKPMGRPSFTPR
jgi:hypothetical protein